MKIFPYISFLISFICWIIVVYKLVFEGGSMQPMLIAVAFMWLSALTIEIRE